MDETFAFQKTSRESTWPIGVIGLRSELDIGRRYAPSCHGAKALSVIGVQNAKGGVAKPRRLFEHRIENRGQIAGAGIDDLQDLGGRGLLREGFAQLPRRVAEGCQRSRHRADLVGPGRRDLNRDVAGVEPVHRDDEAAQRPGNRAQHQEGQQRADENRGRHRHFRQSGGQRRFADDPVAGGNRLGGLLGDDRAEQPIDRDAVLACLGEQRIADHPAIAGVLLDRLGRQLVIGGKLAANLGDAVRLAPRELVEIALHAGAGRFCIGLGKGQQADREIGHPVPHLAECDLRVVRLLDRPEQVGRLDHAGGVVGKLAG